MLPSRRSRFVHFILLPLSVFTLTICWSRGDLLVAQARLKPVSEIVKLSDVQIIVVESGVRTKLLDPNSAIFGRIIAGKAEDKDSLIYVCGWVNAKNTFGGYGGNAPFIGSLVVAGDASIFLPLAVAGDEIQRQGIVNMCFDLELDL